MKKSPAPPLHAGQKHSGGPRDAAQATAASLLLRKKAGRFLKAPGDCQKMFAEAKNNGAAGELEGARPASNGISRRQTA
ncbi:MAG: hypothetical protein DBX49_06320 [Clostridia bacterium]|nr:MAG: hypothetical protein DBX49_06320 [Clostridia bacterium]